MEIFFASFLFAKQWTLKEFSWGLHVAGVLKRLLKNLANLPALQSTNDQDIAAAKTFVLCRGVLFCISNYFNDLKLHCFWTIDFMNGYEIQWTSIYLKKKTLTNERQENTHLSRSVIQCHHYMTMAGVQFSNKLDLAQEVSRLPGPADQHYTTSTCIECETENISTRKYICTCWPQMVL